MKRSLRRNIIGTKSSQAHPKKGLRFFQTNPVASIFK